MNEQPNATAEDLHKLLDDAGVSRKRSMDAGQTWHEYTLADRVILLGKAYKLAEDELDEKIEAQARCCPEDFGFEEYIGILTQRLSKINVLAAPSPEHRLSKPEDGALRTPEDTTSAIEPKS